ncbi:MAG: alpha/beta fold hydrolase [Bacillota bacterium]
MPKVMVNDINIYYEVKGEGFPLVLIMGLAGNLDWWPRELTDRLAGHYKLVLFDNRGAGRTDAPEGEYSIPMFAGDTVGLLDRLGIEKAHIFGVSMGGMIAQEIAISYPERVEKLVLGCTFCGPQHSIPAQPEIINFLINPQSAGLKDFLKILFPEDYIKNNMDKTDEFIRLYKIAPISPEAQLRQVGAVMKFDSLSRLSQIAAPTLVITGDGDVLIPAGNSSILAENIPGARLIVLDGCGHGFMVQEPEKLYIALSDFLG